MPSLYNALQFLTTACVMLIFSFQSTAAQTPQLPQVQGIVLDSADKEPITGANVQLIQKSDTTQKRISVSDIEGKFSIPRVTAGEYTLRITYIGFTPHVRDLTVGSSPLNLGAIVLEEDVQLLKEVVVEGTTMRAEQKGDTLIYNAAAFKVNEDATAEDLVKKMTGITVENGEVKAQGETVRRVLLDGQEFLGDDATAALKNLPAEIVSRIQVFDRQSDQAQFSGFDDGNAERTINILTTGGVTNAQFGRLYTGLGADNGKERYNAGGNLSWFDGQQRISVIGMSNNMNQQNFSSQDLANLGGGGGGGGMNFGRGGGGFGGGDFGGSFFSGNQGGINTTHSMMMNYTNRFSTKLNVNASYHFSHSKNENSSALNRSYFGEDGFSQLYDESNTNASKNGNHRVNMRITWNIDQRNSFIITPRLSTQSSNSDRSRLGKTVLPDFSDLNQSNTRNTSNSSGLNFGNNIMYRRSFEKRGRTFSASLNTNINNRDNATSQLSNNRYYNPNGSFSEQQIDQITNSPTDNSVWSGRINYTEPIGERSQIQLNYDPSLNYSLSERYTYHFDPITNHYSLVDSLLSNEFDNKNITQRAGASYRYNHGKLNMNMGANFQNLRLISEQSFPQTFYGKTSFNSIQPDASIQYRFAQNSQLRLHYRTFSRTPSISQLQNVIDNSNPLRLSSGNPELGQQFTHNVNLRYNLTRVAQGHTFLASFNTSITNNYLGQSVFIARRDTVIADGVLLRNGAQYTRPENLGQSQNYRGYLTYGLPFKPLRSNLSVDVGGSMSRNPSILNNQTYHSTNMSMNTGMVLSSTISPQVDFTATYRLNLSNVSYEQPNQSDTKYTNQTGSFVFTWTPFNKLVFVTDFVMNRYDGLGADLDRSIAVLNAAIGYKFLKKNAAEIRLTGFDLFNQNNNIRRNITDTYIEDSLTDVLTRYFVVTFTYNLRNFNQAPASNRPDFGPGGPGGRGEWRGGPPGGGGRP